MTRSTIAGFIAGALFAGSIGFGVSHLVAQDKPAEAKQQALAQMEAMQKKVKGIVSPGPNHKKLERFLGQWDMEVKFNMPGMKMPGEKGTCKFDWLMEGRWMRMEAKGTMMRRPLHLFSIMGYDNFKQSYVSASVSSMDTTMAHAEGDMDPSDKSMLSYGTIDEYLTGEIGKMCKYVWRFESDDKMVFEVHDLPIGENNTKVVEFIFTRQK